MKCGCSQRRKIDINASQNLVDSDGNPEVYQSRYITLRFYNDDEDSYQTVIVEPHLRVDATCDILIIKNRVPKDVPYSIMEYWPDIGLERVVEDFEHIIDVYNSMEAYPTNTSRMLLFIINPHKFNMFINPLVFFPSDMVNLSEFAGIEDVASSPDSLQKMVRTGPSTPPMFSQIWIRESNGVWSEAYLLLKENNLYVSYQVQIMANFIRHWKNGTLDKQLLSSVKSFEYNGSNDVAQLYLFVCLADYDIYTTIDAKEDFAAPTEFGICFKPNHLYSFDYKTSINIADPTEHFRCITCNTEKARLCWVAAMRLAKYGKQLRENYRSFKNKAQQRDSSGDNSDEKSRSRVAMDFTGEVGRIVEDPREAKAIAELEEEEPCMVKIRPSIKSIPEKLNPSKHIDQPWFHSNLNRDQSTMLINKHSEQDGAFLVRESKSNPGIYVLTFRCKDKIIHSQIQPIVENGCKSLFYTLDGGQTKFYDLIQLIDFYQLNAGCLPTRLTKYIKCDIDSNIGSNQSSRNGQKSLDQQQQTTGGDNNNSLVDVSDNNNNAASELASTIENGRIVSMSNGEIAAGTEAAVKNGINFNGANGTGPKLNGISKKVIGLPEKSRKKNSSSIESGSSAAHSVAGSPSAPDTADPELAPFSVS